MPYALRNRVIICGHGGIQHTAQDTDSIAKYGVRAIRITDSSILTPEQAIDVANAYLARWSEITHEVVDHEIARRESLGRIFSA